MAIEDEFDIEIADSDAPNLEHVGEMYDCVLKAMRRRGESPNEREVWTRLREIMVEELGVRAEQVIPEACFVKDLGVS